MTSNRNSGASIYVLRVNLGGRRRTCETSSSPTTNQTPHTPTSHLQRPHYSTPILITVLQHLFKQYTLIMSRASTPDSSKPSSPRPPTMRGLRTPSTRQSALTRHSFEQGGATTPIPDEDQGADLPLNMTASVVLTGLPRDAHQALADVEAVDSGKGTIEHCDIPFCGLEAD